MRRSVRLGSLILAASMFILAGCGSNNTASKNDTESQIKFDNTVYAKQDIFIDPSEVKEKLGSDDIIILDCNKPDVYEKEHIKGAIGIGFHYFSDKVGKPGDEGWGTIKKKEDLQKAIQSLGITKDKLVVFYSDAFKGPGADGRAVWQLKMSGLNNVRILAGGLTDWKELGYDVSKEPVEATSTNEIVDLKEYDESYYTTKERIKENLGKEVLIDVRTKKEFEGSQNAGEPRGGHIEGAVHVEWLELLNKNGTPKSPDEIKSIMKEKAGVTVDDDFTVY